LGSITMQAIVAVDEKLWRGSDVEKEEAFKPRQSESWREPGAGACQEGARIRQAAAAAEDIARRR